MLFTDGNPADSDALRGYESAILDVASSQGIDLNIKLDLASEQIGDEIESWLKLRGNGPAPSNGVLGSVVISSAVRRWHAMQALEMVYRDAYYQDLNDRYKAKWQMYRALRTEARDLCYASGIGLVGAPVPRGPKLSCSIGLGTGPEATAFVRATWVDPRGSEGAPGPIVSIAIPPDGVLIVLPAEAGAAGLRWNLYAGDDQENLRLQNDVPMEAYSAWSRPGALRQSGPVPATGQAADYWVVENRRLQRG